MIVVCPIHRVAMLRMERWGLDPSSSNMNSVVGKISYLECPKYGFRSNFKRVVIKGIRRGRK